MCHKKRRVKKINKILNTGTRYQNKGGGHLFKRQERDGQEEGTREKADLGYKGLANISFSLHRRELRTESDRGIKAYMSWK